MAPFESVAQQKFLHAHPEKVGGEKKLAEWDKSTDFDNLPERKEKKKPGPKPKPTKRMRHTTRPR